MSAGLQLDRLVERRRAPDWLDALLESPRLRLLLVHQGRALVTGPEARPRLAELRGARARDLLAGTAEPILLGALDEAVYVAAMVEQAGEPPLPEAWYAELRGSANRLPTAHAQLFAYARAMTHWHATHRYCGRCGAPTASRDAGHLRVCGNPACGQSLFPRTDPAVIVRVTHGARLLLGRQAAWPPGRYSVIAGFVEPGERAEEAVLREIREETGLSARAPRYVDSQPWPFPGSLMLGFAAEAETAELSLPDGELEAARFFTREEIRRETAAGRLVLSTRFSIARRLIDDWLNADA